MLPALLFFVLHDRVLPADRAARRCRRTSCCARSDLPLFHLLFQLMIFAALLESGTGAVHAINERIGNAWQRARGARSGAGARARHRARRCSSSCMFLAERFGLVALIASGYRALACCPARVYVAAAADRRRSARLSRDAPVAMPRKPP